MRLRSQIPIFLCSLAFKREAGLESLAMGIIPDRAGRWMLWKKSMDQSRKKISRKVD